MTAPLVPDSPLEAELRELHAGACPQCGGAGPVDLHDSRWVWSALIVTRTGCDTVLSCRRCARKRQGGAILRSLALGWWGVPFGLILTPVQVGRTTYGLCFPPDPSRPSARLRQFVSGSADNALREQRSKRCPHCAAPYDPDDYRADAVKILCPSCGAEVPRA